MTSAGESAGSRPRETADIETSSEIYARRFAGPIGRYFLDMQHWHVRALIEPWARGQVLDVGGGHAQLAVPLVREGFEVTVAGSDPVCEARLVAALAPGSYRFRACDLLDLPFADRTFDAVVAVRLLPHVARWQRLLQEMCRVARYAVIVDYPAVASANVMARRLFGLKRAIEPDTRPYRCFRRGELLEVLAAQGFDAPTFRPQFAVPMVAHRRVGSVRLSRAAEAAARALGITGRFGSPVIMRVVRPNSLMSGRTAQ